MIGVARTVAVQYVTFALQVVLLLAVARLLGPEEQGRFAVYRSFVFIAESVMWLGLVSGTTYFIASHRERYHDLIIRSAFSYWLVLLTVGVILIHLLLPRGLVGLVRGYLIVGWVLLFGVQQTMQKIFLGEGRLGLFALLSLLNAVAVALLVGILWRVQAVSLDNVLAAHAAATALTAIVAIGSHRRHLHSGLLLPRINLPAARSLWSVGILGYISSIAFLLFYRVDFFFVDHFLGARLLGQYSVAVFIAEAAQKLPDWMGMVLSRQVASGMDVRGDLRRRYLRISLVAMALIAVALLFLAAIGVDYASLILGPEYAQVAPFVLLLLPKAFVYCAMVIYAADLSGRGYTGYHPLSGVAALVTLGCVDLVFMPTYGINAAFFAVTVAMVVCTLIVMRGVARQVRAS